MMMFIGVIGVSDDVPVLEAYPIFWNEKRVYSKTAFTFTKKKNTAFVGIVFLSLQL